MSSSPLAATGTQTGAPTINRWLVVVAAMAIMVCTGAMYAFSVFRDALVSQQGIPLPEVMTAYSVNMGLSPIPMILGGYLVDRRLARWLVIVGGALFGLGWVLSAFATSGTMLIVTYGLMSGLGQGLLYSAALNNTLKFFPDRRGTAAGLITAANGGATIILAPVAASLSRTSVANMFLTLGIVFCVVIAIASLFIRVAPPDYRPAGWTPPATSGGGGVTNFTWTQMLRTPAFWLIFGIFVCGAFSGLMITANASPIGQKMFGLTAATAALFVSIYSASNMLGRFVFGAVSDRVGQVRTLLVVFTVVALSLVVLVTFKGAGNTVAFAIGLIGLGLTFGGVMGVMPALVMGHFGPKYQGINYGIAFSAYSVAALYAPPMAAGIGAANNGDYSQAFVIAIIAAAIGLGLSLGLLALQRASARRRATA